MPFPGILGGFETRQKQFFAYFWSQEKNQKKKFSRKNRFLSVKIGFFSGKNRFLSEKSAIFRRFFFFSDFSIPISFPAPSKFDFSPKNRPKSAIFLSMLRGSLFFSLFFFKVNYFLKSKSKLLLEGVCFLAYFF